MTVIETDRLLLRFVEASDLDALAAIYSDAEVMRFVGGPLDRNGAWDRIRMMQNFYRQRRFGPYATVLKATGYLIGRCGFLFWNIDGQDEIEVAYLLARRDWGQGLATEAVRAIVQYGFKRLLLTRMIALIHPENIASIRVAEKSGLKLEKETVLPHGRRLVFSIQDAGSTAVRGRVTAAQTLHNSSAKGIAVPPGID